MFEVRERFSLTLDIGWRVVDCKMSNANMETVGQLLGIQ